MRWEVQLLLACSHCELRTEEAERIRALLREELDWVYLIRLGAAHRLLPLAHKNLRSVAADLVPPATLNAIGRYCQATSKTSQTLFHEMFEVLSIFEQHGIPAIPYKGPILGFLAYGDPLAREFLDLDFLVQPRHQEKAVTLLLEAGFRIDHEKDPHVVLLRGQTSVEIHWSFFPEACYFGINTCEFWERTRPLTVNGRPITTLPIEDWLLILSFHAAKHSFTQIDWIRDIAELVRRHADLDWDRLFLLAKHRRHRRYLAVSLSMAQRLFDVEVPSAAQKSLPSKWLTAMLVHPAIRILSLQPDVSTHYALRILTLLLLHHPREALHTILDANQRDQAFAGLPRGLSFLSVLARPLRLLNDYLRPSLPSFADSFGGLLRRRSRPAVASRKG
jgi:hypothetical protein